MSFNLWEFLLGPKRPRSYVDPDAAWPRTEETYKKTFDKTSDLFSVSVQTDGIIAINVKIPDPLTTSLKVWARATAVEDLIQELQKAVVASKQMTQEVPSECMFDPEMYKDNPAQDTRKA